MGHGRLGSEVVPANYRMERHERYKVPSGGVSARGAHAER